MRDGLLAVVVGFTVLLSLRRAAQWWARQAGRRRLRGATVLRAAYGVRVGALVQDKRAFPRLNPKRRTRLTGDLFLTQDRLLLVTQRGVLLDLPRSSAEHLTGARAPGPGRLVLEGRAPGQAEGLGLFRFELSIDESAAWAAALTDFVQPASA